MPVRTAQIPANRSKDVDRCDGIAPAPFSTVRVVIAYSPMFLPLESHSSGKRPIVLRSPATSQMYSPRMTCPLHTTSWEAP